MTYPLAIDIETAANDRADDYFKAQRYDAPANYKDPAKIEQAIIEKRHTAMTRAGLTWWTGRVIEICAIDVSGRYPPQHYSGEDELALLCAFGNDLTDRFSGHYLTSKHGLDFDYPFLTGRFMAHDIGVPPQLRHVGQEVHDVNKIFGWSSSSNQRGHLADYAWGLGINGKNGHGSEVQAMFDRARLGDEKAWADLRSYCQQDTQIVVDILRRYVKRYPGNREVDLGEGKDFAT